MAYRVITQVSEEPVSLEEARLQCKLDSDDLTWDSNLAGLITAAREYAEHYCGRAFAPVTLEMALDEFPRCNPNSSWNPARETIQLSMPPVSSVTSIKYDDTAGVEQTLATSVYAFSLYGEAREISLKYGQVWPSTLCQKNAVRIRYVTGAAPAQTVKAAMLLHIEMEFPNNAYTPDERAAMGKARDALLDPAKVHGF